MLCSRFTVGSADSLLSGAPALLVVGRRDILLDAAFVAQLPLAVQPLWPDLLSTTGKEYESSQASTWYTADDGSSRQLWVLVLPATASRHNCPARPDVLVELLRSASPKGSKLGLLLVLDDVSQATPLAAAAARACHLYSAKTGNKDAGKELDLAFWTPPPPSLESPAAPPAPIDLAAIQRLCDAVRQAARLVDSPCSELDSAAFVREAVAVASSLGAGVQVIQGDELRARGYGGLSAVGRAARIGPALVVLSHQPKDATHTTVWVGKGIVYDTGGLSLKSREHMGGMKGDMAGAAAVLQAFAAAVRGGYAERLHAVLCIAENAMGPDAYRPDDVLRLYSGRSVEINNTDAEGRLVLADGVAHAVKHLSPDLLIDMATLTGAQLVATGRLHAGIVCNDEALEAAAVRAGRECGDLVFPLPYCPDLFRSEFRSKVADMKNSVKDRMNAQTSCSAQFVAEHLCDYRGPWLHVDMAGPAWHEDRATGYGVAFLLRLLELRG